MHLFTGIITHNSEILPGVHLLEVQAGQLARTAQPGQYCMLRGSASLATDPLLRRPLFVAEVEPGRNLCRFLVYIRGRVSHWLAHQQAGMALDILGPLGHGWTLRPEVRNLLLLGVDHLLTALLLLSSHALERELSVTLLHHVASADQAYPAALLPPEIEYQVFVASGESWQKELLPRLSEYLAWADAACCGLSADMLATLVSAGGRWREQHFAQVIVERPLMCVTESCLACQLEVRHRPRLLCRDGPVFALRDLMEDW